MSQTRRSGSHRASKGRIAVVTKGYPRLSETFIAQELLALQRRGIAFEIWSLRHPHDDKSHEMHARITANVTYLPEYLRNDPGRVLRGLMWALRRPALLKLLGTWFNDLRRDPTVNRLRRFGQALVLARELPDDIAGIYAHFLHTPASVARYAALSRGLPWAFSAHAKDIWTIPVWEKREKIRDACFGTTCTGFGAEHLAGLGDAPDKVDLIYHGIDLSRFPAPPERAGDNSDRPLALLSVGRLVEKKGYRTLLKALTLLPKDLDWRFVHIGGGELKSELHSAAESHGLGNRIDWLGPRDQAEVIAAMRAADLFVLPSQIARTGDRDGLPNVLMEAAAQKLPVVSTRTSAIPEFIDDGIHGALVEPENPDDLAAAIADLARNPERRRRYADAAHQRLVTGFSCDPGIDRLAIRLRDMIGQSSTDLPATTE